MDFDRGAAFVKRVLALLLCGAALPAMARAQDLHAQGFVEARAVSSSLDDASWTDGGLAKTRYGEGDPALAFAGALSLSWQASASLLAVVDLQAQPQASPQLGVVSAYLRWRPVSTSRWRWSARAGAFFPPVSLENDGVGWTSRWTLTPSAINSWVGEELRTIGAEARLEHRSERFGSIEGGVSVFKWNDPAGDLIAARGWALGDVTSPLNATVREPDAGNGGDRIGYKPFVENDGRPGWHADLQWTSASGLRLRLLRYDNRADPNSESEHAGREVYSWRTRFDSFGAELPRGQWVLAGQWMDGSTIIEPVPDLYFDTRFRAAYLLAARDAGKWRPALRYDRFRIRNVPDFAANPMDEDGHAWTLAMNWRPSDAWRLTGEWLRVDSRRGQRAFQGLPARQREQLLQLSLRYQF
jgi:hypothetical protein